MGVGLMTQHYPTASTVQLFDAELYPPPKGHKKLIVYRDGLLDVRSFIHGWHEAWAYLPKAPESLKERKRIKSEQELMK